MKVLIMVVAALLIILFMLQEGKTEGILSSSQIYKNVKERGPEKAVFIVTGVLSVLFMVLALMEAV